MKNQGKIYSQEEIKSKFRKNKCLECIDGKLLYDGILPSGWIAKYKCSKCGIIYEFTESDMGQTLPYLESDAN